MGSEIQSERGKQAQDLRDLQDSYRKKRQAIEASGDHELDKVRKDNADKVRTESASGEAAVNHVRLSNREKLEDLKSETDQKLTYERKSLGKRYQSSKEMGNEQLEALDENLRTKKENVREGLQKENRFETEISQRESQATGKIAQEESARRAKIATQAQEEIQELHHRAQDEKAKLNDNARHDIGELSQKHQKEITQLQDRHKIDFQKQSEWSLEQLNSQKEEQEKRIESERQEYLKNELALREHAGQVLHDEQREANVKLGSVKKENRQEIEHARDQGIHGMEKTRAYYDKNIGEVHQRGEVALHSEREVQEDKLRQLAFEHKQELDNTKLEFEAEVKDRDDAHKRQAELSQTAYRQSLLEQRHQYDQAIQRNMKSFEQQVKDQREQLSKSLVREKKEVMEDIGRYNTRNSDPFYRITQPQAELHESGNHYLVRAHIPEHERENFHVIVQPDRVIVQGQRDFADQIDEPDSKVATHNFQTYRQEIALEHPVREKFVTSSYENGVMTVRIPKA